MSTSIHNMELPLNPLKKEPCSGQYFNGHSMDCPAETAGSLEVTSIRACAHNLALWDSPTLPLRAPVAVAHTTLTNLYFRNCSVLFR